MKKIFLTILLSGLLFVYADDDYTLGQGFKSDKLPINIGGYITGFYSNRADKQSVVSLDDIAVMAYGDIAPHISTMVEFESAGFYEKTFQNGTSNEIHRGTLRAERAYLNYSSSDVLGIRVGKFITPAGIWNQTPVPVFKETFSKPRLSMEMFPRFSTGAMVYGATPVLEADLEYNLFTQIGRDLDPAYNNIESSDGVGGSLGISVDGWSGGAAFGQYKNIRMLNNTQYFGIYQSYSANRLKVTAEAFVAYDRYDTAESKERRYKKQSYYVQGVYKILPQLSGVLRNEYFSNEFNNDKNVINIIGLNYKPRPAISFKIEKQFNSQKASDIVIASFSVLF
jgi:hypothetical protein